MDGALLAQVLSPLITAALAGLAVLLRDWRRSRRWEHRRDRTLTQGRAEIGYFQDWLECSCAVCGIRGPGWHPRARLVRVHWLARSPDRR